MDYDKLIERLRNNNIENNCHDCALGYYAFESATALEKLQAENDQLRDSRDRWKKCAEDFSAGVTQRDKEEERILAENEKLRADVVRLNDMLASYQNVLVPELRVENENLKERIEDTRLEWYAKGFGEVIAEVKRVRAELEYEKEHANAYYEECGQWEAENEKLRAELEQVKRENSQLMDARRLRKPWIL